MLPLEEREVVQTLLMKFPPERTWVLPALWRVFETVGWLNPDRIEWVSEHLKVPYAEVYGVASFYSLFSWKPQAFTTVHVCTDVLCALKSGDQIYEDLGRASQDGSFSVSPVTCLGRCDLAPACLINYEPHGPVTADSVVKKIQEIALDGSGGGAKV